MPPSDFQILPPTEWQRFETLCWRLWRELLRDPSTQPTGRRGQTQHGVDVSGRRDGTNWVGIQCKCKDNLLRTKVTESELKDEAANALGFEPALAEFILATTGPRDALIQRHARTLSVQYTAEGRFSVTVVSWDDIRQELDSCPETAQWYCPWLLPPSPVSTGDQCDFLISHAPGDTVAANQLATTLERHDLAVEVRRWPARASDHHVRRMCDGNRSARRVIALYSEEYEVMAFANEPQWKDRFRHRTDGQPDPFRLIRATKDPVADWVSDAMLIDLPDGWESNPLADVVARILSQFGADHSQGSSLPADSEGVGQ